jgi:hypothetical protein
MIKNGMENPIYTVTWIGQHQVVEDQ